MKKILIPLVVIALAILAVTFWSTGERKEKEAKTSGSPMKVGRAVWPGMYWIEIADQKGWFAEAGLNVELVDTNSDYFQSLQDVVDGKIDVTGFSLFDILRLNADGAELALVINCDDSRGVEAIIAGENIANIASLQGKKIGVDLGSYTDYILSTVLAEYGMNENDVARISLSGEAAPGAISQRTVDAVVTWEPYITKILSKEKARIVFDTSEIPGVSPNGQTFRRSFLEKRPEDVQAYVNVWHKTTQFIKDNPDQSFGIIADRNGMAIEEVKSFAQNDKILGLDDNIISFAYGAGLDSLHGAARKMNNFMIKKGITNERLNSTTFIEDRFIRTLKHSRL